MKLYFSIARPFKRSDNLSIAAFIRQICHPRWPSLIHIFLSFGHFVMCRRRKVEKGESNHTDNVKLLLRLHLQSSSPFHVLCIHACNLDGCQVTNY